MTPSRLTHALSGPSRARSSTSPTVRRPTGAGLECVPPGRTTQVWRLPSRLPTETASGQGAGRRQLGRRQV